MIEYDNKHWVRFLFKSSGYHFDGVFFSLLIYGTLVGILVFAHLSFDFDIFHIPASFHTVLGLVIGLLLVFRTNTAYERWWEGRKLWGAIVNDCRSAFLKISCRISNEEDKKEIAELFRLYIHNAKNNLRANKKNLVFEKYEDSTKDNSPVQVMKLIYTKLKELEKKGDLNQGDLIQIDVNLNGLIASLGGCQRIKNTPIPYSYSLFIKKFIFLYVITLPIVFFHFDYWAVLITTFVFFGIGYINE